MAFNELLIELAKDYACLFNQKIKVFETKEKKKNASEEICLKLNYPETPESSNFPPLVRERTEVADSSRFAEPLQDSSISSSSGDVIDEVPLCRSSVKTRLADEIRSSNGIFAPIQTRSKTSATNSAPVKRKKSIGDVPSPGVKTRRMSMLPKSGSKSDIGIKTRSSAMSLRRSKKSI